MTARGNAYTPAESSRVESIPTSIAESGVSMPQASFSSVGL